MVGSMERSETETKDVTDERLERGNGLGDRRICQDEAVESPRQRRQTRAAKNAAGCGVERIGRVLRRVLARLQARD